MGVKNAILRFIGLRRGLMIAITLALIFGMMVSFLAEPAAAGKVGRG